MATTSSLSRNFPTLRYLAAPFRWFFRSRRRVLILAAALLAMLAVPPIWWSIQLVGLPDIGEPFDLAAFRSLAIPDDRNACVLYREAADRLKPLATSSQEQDDKIDPHVRWSQAHPAVRRWVEENREAMDLYRRGTERPDALDPTSPSMPDPTNWYETSISSRHWPCWRPRGWRIGVTWRGAWGWYGAALRSTYHLGLRGTIGRAAHGTASP